MKTATGSISVTLRDAPSVGAAIAQSSSATSEYQSRWSGEMKLEVAARA
jgi:hypothetical protein